MRLRRSIDNIGDVIRVAGVSSESYAGYNDLYRITDVATLVLATSITVASASTVSGSATVGIGSTGELAVGVGQDI